MVNIQGKIIGEIKPITANIVPYAYPACDYESKNTFRHTIGVFSSVDRDKDHHFIIADLGPIVLKTLSPEETACNKIRFSHD